MDQLKKRYTRASNKTRELLLENQHKKASKKTEELMKHKKRRNQRQTSLEINSGGRKAQL